MDTEYGNVVVEHNHDDDGGSSVTISGGPDGFACLVTGLITSMIEEEHLTLIVDGETVEPGSDEYEAA